MDDLRLMERFSMRLNTKIKLLTKGVGNGINELVTYDVCGGGAFFATKTPYPTHTSLKFEILLPLEKLLNDDIKSVIHVSGRVIRSYEDGMAVHFGRGTIKPLPYPEKDHDHGKVEQSLGKQLEN